MFGWFKTNSQRERGKLQVDLDSYYQKVRFLNQQKIESYKKAHPLLNVHQQILEALQALLNAKDLEQAKYEAAYAKYSWWQKLNSEDPDLKHFDQKIEELKAVQKRLFDKYGQGKIQRIAKTFDELLETSETRLKAAYLKASVELQNSTSKNSVSGAFQAGLLCSAFSVSYSVADDLSTTGAIYDSLRKVNGNFANLSDGEIWWSSLWMSDAQLQGLQNLTKGAYFEDLVATKTGGTLFEHFNHKDTDIIIDGVEVQLKATDSVDYIESIDPEISVLATSEVADLTEAIDSGISNLDLTDSIELALGGTVLDFADTTADAIFSGLGGLGTFATLRGVHHGVKEYRNTGDLAQAFDEGVEVAIVGNLKGLVNTSEMVYKTATSRPSKFVGGVMWKGAKRIGKIVSKI